MIKPFRLSTTPVRAQLQGGHLGRHTTASAERVISPAPCAMNLLAINGVNRSPHCMATDNTNTVRLHRVLRATPERVYRAFLDADAMAKWLPPNGFTGKVHEMDAREGGTYKMSFTNFSTGKSHSFGGKFLELKPRERIRYTDKFDDANLPGEMVTTIMLKEVFCGTELNITQEGIPAVIPAEACYMGWQESLILLGKLVEAEIPDQP